MTPQPLFTVTIADEIGFTHTNLDPVDLPPALAASFEADPDLKTLDATYANGDRWTVTRT